MRACRRLAQERQHRLVDGEDAEHVGLPHRAHFIEGHVARAGCFCVLLDGLAGQPVRVRDGCVLDEHVETAKLLANALRRGGDRSLNRHVELERVGVRPDLPGRGLAALEIARPDQHSEAVRGEILCDLKTDSLIRPGDQGDGFILHSDLLRVGNVLSGNPKNCVASGAAVWIYAAARSAAGRRRRSAFRIAGGL